MATIIKADGTEEGFHIPEGDESSLKAFQAIVGGYIEGVMLEDGRAMYVNEDGTRLKLPMNGKATALAKKIILGDVVVGGRTEMGY
jgi:hypothetical protein